MNISTHDKKILFVCFRRLLFLTLAFLLGSLAGKAELSLGIHPVSGPVLSSCHETAQCKRTGVSHKHTRRIYIKQ